MIEALLLVLAVGHYGYEVTARLMEVDRGRIFYIFQGVIGAGLFWLAPRAILAVRARWPAALRHAVQFVALAGLAEQTLVVTCGCARLYDPVFNAPPGEGLCGGQWYGIGLAAVAWLAVLVWRARR